MIRNIPRSFSCSNEFWAALEKYRIEHGLRSVSEAIFVSSGLGMKIDPTPYLAVRNASVAVAVPEVKTDKLKAERRKAAVERAGQAFIHKRSYFPDCYDGISQEEYLKQFVAQWDADYKEV